MLCSFTLASCRHVVSCVLNFLIFRYKFNFGDCHPDETNDIVSDLLEFYGYSGLNSLKLLRERMSSIVFPTRLNVLARLAKSKCRQIVHQMFHRYLLYTNVAISVSLSGVGDTLEQHYEILSDQKEDWEKSRTMRMSISGMTVGVICHNWYKYLDTKFPGRTVKIVARKVMIDQIICSPLCIATFFITLGILERASWAETKKEIKDKAWRLYAAEWVVWPPAQVINFYILPLRYRVLYDNTISLGYDVYTSYVKHDNDSVSEDTIAEDKLGEEEEEEDDNKEREVEENGDTWLIR